jgi:DNA recombination protein RmuC
MNMFIAFIVGLALGAAIIGIMYFRQKSSHMEAMQACSGRVQILEVQMDVERKHFQETKATTEETHRKAMEAQEARFKETLARVSSEMKSVTEEMLKQRQQEFSQSSTQNL